MRIVRLVSRLAGTLRTASRAALSAILVVALAGSLAVAAGAWYWSNRNSADAEARMANQHRQVAGQVQRALVQYGVLLSGSGALFHQGNVTRAQYQDYLKAVGLGTSKFPGLEGVGLIQKVPDWGLADFLAGLRRDRIYADVSPPGRRSVYCLGSYADWTNITFSVPIYGFDACSVPALARSLDAATRTGSQQVLPGAALDTRYQADFLLIQPVYKGSPVNGPERIRSVTGWVVALTNGPALLKAAVPAPGVQFEVLSSTAGTAPPEVIFRSPRAVASSGTWTEPSVIDAYGTWTVRFRSGGAKGADQGGPLTLLCGGLVAVALLVLLLTSLLSSRRRAESAVERATRTLQQSEERFRRLVSASSDIIMVVSESCQLQSANDAAYTVLDIQSAEQNLLELVHPDDRPVAEGTLALLLTTPDAHPSVMLRVRGPDGNWRMLEAVATNCVHDPAIAGIIVNARDVTDRNHLTRALTTLGHCNQVLVRATDEQSLLDETCRTIVSAGGYRLVWVGFGMDDPDRAVVPVASAGTTDYVSGLRVSWADNCFGNGPTGKAVRTGEVQVFSDFQESDSFAPWKESAQDHGLRSSCALPLKVGGKTIGALSLYAAEPNVFGPSEVALLTQLADSLAYGIGRIRDAASLVDSEERFRSLAGAAPIGILEVGMGGQVTYANAKMAEIAGREVSKLLGVGWLDAVHPEDIDGLRQVIHRTELSGSKTTMALRIVRDDGEVRHLQMLAAPKANSSPPAFVVAVADITKEVEAKAALTHQAFYDTLTGLPNRVLFLDRLNQELAWQSRREGKIAVLFMDLDRFKLVNDSLGHETGDVVLREAGARFSRTVRAGETAARFSGDEFIFIIRDVKEPADAVAAAQRLLDALGEPIRSGGRNLTVCGSIGIVIPGPGATAAAVLRDADTAMYQAKIGGRNRCEVFDETLHRRSVARLEMETELRQALASGEFELFYQPAVRPASGEPVSAEALVRWRHPDRGLVAPSDFIPVAEDTGLIGPLGAWVFEQAVAQLARWDSDPDAPRLAVLSINLSARQLDDATTPQMVSRVLDQHGVDPGRIALEITESVIMADSDSTRNSLEAFKRLGLRIAIDDFGTGYSSLGRLHTLPVTAVKVDRSFTQRLTDSDQAAPVIQAVIDMSHAMDLRVIVEGVETEGVRQQITSMGCELAQGFLWAQPMPAHEFEEWWRHAAHVSFVRI